MVNEPFSHPDEPYGPFRTDPGEMTPADELTAQTPYVVPLGRDTVEKPTKLSALEFTKLPEENPEGFEDEKEWWMYYFSTSAQFYFLFNGVITIMVLTWGYLRTITDGTNTGIVSYIAVFGPLVFFFAILPRLPQLLRRDGLLHAPQAWDPSQFPSFREARVLGQKPSGDSLHYSARRLPLLLLLVLGCYQSSVYHLVCIHQQHFLADYRLLEKPAERGRPLYLPHGIHQGLQEQGG